MSKSQTDFFCLINIKLRINKIQASAYKNKKKIYTHFTKHIPRQKQRVNRGRKANLFNYKIILDCLVFEFANALDIL